MEELVVWLVESESEVSLETYASQLGGEDSAAWGEEGGGMEELFYVFYLFIILFFNVQGKVSRVNCGRIFKLEGRQEWKFFFFFFFLWVWRLPVWWVNWEFGRCKSQFLLFCILLISQTSTACGLTFDL